MNLLIIIFISFFTFAKPYTTWLVPDKNDSTKVRLFNSKKKPKDAIAKAPLDENGKPENPAWLKFKDGEEVCFERDPDTGKKLDEPKCVTPKIPFVDEDLKAQALSNRQSQKEALEQIIKDRTTLAQTLEGYLDEKSVSDEIKNVIRFILNKGVAE